MWAEYVEQLQSLKNINRKNDMLIEIYFNYLVLRQEKFMPCAQQISEKLNFIETDASPSAFCSYWPVEIKIWYAYV